jgi:hypothetical protein
MLQVHSYPAPGTLAGIVVCPWAFEGGKGSYMIGHVNTQLKTKNDRDLSLSGAILLTRTNAHPKARSPLPH